MMQEAELLVSERLPVRPPKQSAYEAAWRFGNAARYYKIFQDDSCLPKPDATAYISIRQRVPHNQPCLCRKLDFITGLHAQQHTAEPSGFSHTPS